MKKIYKLGGRLMQKNNKEEFNVIFRGDIEYIDSEILLANLLTTTEIIQEINKELEGKEIEIYIKPFAPGSFEISYILAHVGFVSGLFNVISGTNISGLKFILNIFRDILNLKKLLGGKKPQEIIQHENKVEIKSAQGNTITVIDKSLNIYMNNVHIESAINKGFKNLEKNEAITDYVIEEKDGKVLFDVNREQYKNLGNYAFKKAGGEKMRCIKRNNEMWGLHLSQEEIDGLAKCSFYISEIKEAIKAGELRRKQALFESLVNFLLDVRNGFLQITE